MRKVHLEKGKKMKYLYTGLCKAVQLLVIVWSNLLQWEFLLKQEVGRAFENVEEAGFVHVGNQCLQSH